MDEIIDAYIKNLFRYIKDVVDHIEKTKEGLRATNVSCGFTVVSNVYLMSLLNEYSSIIASSNAKRASTIYIDFILQMTGLDVTSNGPVKIGTRDAASFVYKKILHPINLVPATTNLIKNKAENESDEKTDTKMSMSNVVVLPNDTKTRKKYDKNKKITLEKLHLCKCLFCNTITVLFTHSMFYDEKTNTVDYYSFVINKLLQLGNVLEKTKLSISQYKRIVSSQYNRNNSELKISTKEDVYEYIQWLIEEINTE